MRFCHLHTHTEYSLLDGEASVKKLVSRIKELGMDSCAITDHGSMFGVAEFWQECRAQGIKPIIGCEVYVAPRTRFDKVHGVDNKTYHLILLAENQQGYKNLMYLVSRANIDGFYYKPRVDMELLRERHEGLIALSACIAGQVPREMLGAGYESGKETALKYIEIFGKENYFLEIQDHGLAEQKRLIPMLRRLADELGVGLVATNDIHYLTKEDAKYQDVLMCIQMEKTVNDPDRMKFETEEFYIKSPEEMESLFSYVPEAVENTAKIADRCNVELDFGAHHLPTFKVPGGMDAYEYLHRLCDEGLKKHYDPVTDELRNRLEYELGVIKSMGFVDYFLIVRDFIHFAKTHGVPVGPGRGSAAGSIVAYTLGITNIDPIRYNLIFERFLNPERVSMPDIDIDFEPSGRQKVIDYVVEQYGADQVSQIVTFGTMKAKLAIRDVGRALDIPYTDVDRVAKLIPKELNITIDKAMQISAELKSLYDSDAKIKELIDTARALEGLPRHASTHAAGVVITSEPLVEYIPLTVNKDGFIATQYTKDTVEALGLLKMDFLGLKNLTVIANAAKLVKETHGIELDMDRLPLDKKEVYELISSGNTDGVFQLESAGMQSMMMELHPDNIEDIVAGIALYRPGPMEQIPRYIRNKKNRNNITYKHPLLKDILNVTYGCMVYQEQVMDIVRALAGYSMGKADQMRRIISKKKLDKMEIERNNFIYGSEDGSIKGCIKNGIDEKTAKEIFDEIDAFASYAFNKSHAAAYAVVCYQTAYLKTFYPVEFMAALISCEEETTKINQYIANCTRMGISVLRPDVNYSESNFSVEGNAVRFGLSAVKNVGKSVIDNIVKERKRGGSFKSFSDFIDRCEGLGVNKRAVEGMIKCGAFDSMGLKRSQLLRVYERAVEGSARNARDNVAGQMSLFDNADERREMELPDIPELEHRELLRLEKESTGMYFSGHPMDSYADKVKTITKINIGTILESGREDEAGIVNSEIHDNDFVVVCGLIETRKNKTTRKNSQMAFVTVADVYGSIECLVFPTVLQRYSQILQEGEIVCLTGRVSMREDEEPKLLCETVETIDEALKNSQQRTPEKRGDRNYRSGADNSGRQRSISGSCEPQDKRVLYIRFKSYDKEILDKLAYELVPYSGDVQVRLYFEQEKRQMSVPRRLYFNGTAGAIRDLQYTFGKENVKLKG
ncbi:MAG: DNA polymerase III subunit alpha [bacterium]|nr:DNA polymerase III subunit alpha [bacterium]